MAPTRVLLTGANGFIGSHILHQLLTAGISVRSVLRSQSKVDAVRADHPSSSSQLDFAIVPDITAPGAFDSALQSTPPFDAVVHTASPFLYSAANGADDFLGPAVKGTTEVLKSITKVAPSVKRVVLTSSFAAVHSFGQRDDKNKVYTDQDWNPVTWDEAVATTDLGFAYRASKKFAEKAAWEFIASERPAFDLVTFTPPMVYGPLRHAVSSPAQLNESNLRIYNLFFKDTTPASPIPPNGLPLYVDVRDLARAHLAAVVTPAAGNRRFLITPGPVSSQEISDILRERVPGAEERVPAGQKGAQTLPDGQFTADTTPVQGVLGLKYTSKEDTFTDLGKQLLEIEKNGKQA